MPARSRPSVDLPAPEGPDDRHALARLEVEVDAVQDVAILDVRVPDVLGAQVVAVRLVVLRLPVGRHADDPDEARERGRADLDLVEPGDEPVDRVGELHDVERDRGHLADRGLAVRDEPAAPGERRGDRQHVRELGGREPDRAEEERSHLGLVRVVEVGVDAVDALLPQAQSLHGSATLDRLADGSGQRRVRRALPEVARRSPAEVPLGAEEEQRHACDAGQGRQGVDPDGRGDGEHRRDRRDHRLGHGKAHRAGERVDVGRRARDEVACARPLDRREREAEHAAHEVLAELGEDLLREHERRPPGEPREDGLEDEERGQDEDDLVHVRARRPIHHGLDESAEQRRPGETGGRGSGVQADHARQPAPVAATQPLRLHAELIAGRDREQLVHTSSPRVTVHL